MGDDLAGWLRDHRAAALGLAWSMLVALPVRAWARICASIRHAGTSCVVAGLNIRPHRPPTKSGKPVLFTSVEDETDVLHINCVGEAIDSCTATLLLAPAVLVEGTIERHGPSGQGGSLLVERTKTLKAERFVTTKQRRKIYEPSEGPIIVTAQNDYCRR